MSVDESRSFRYAKQQLKEMLEEFNRSAPYGQEYRRHVEVSFTVPEEQIENVRAVLNACSIDFSSVRMISDPENYAQYRL